MNSTFYENALTNKVQYMKKHSVKNSAIDFECVLAQDYLIQPKDNVFFFFNPFSVQIFRKVVNNILRSVELEPRQISLILYYPSIDYVQFLQYETNFELENEIFLKEVSIRNINERILVFNYM